MTGQSPVSTCLICGVILTATVFFQPIGACMRPAEPTASPAAASPEDGTKIVVENGTNIIVTEIELPCTAEQMKARSCLNKATCLQKINIHDNNDTTSRCRCEDGYHGTRCEASSRRLKGTEDSLSVEAIIGIVLGICGAIAMVLVIIKVIKLPSSQARYNASRMNSRSSQQAAQNGTSNGSLGHDNPAGPTADTPVMLVKKNPLGKYEEV
ncbi:uncharacterized protein [Watersipora subatra]|uniref:uncharacterized protein isoform X2 n=1 Tax=Watersipora subatra TaxID=2589382 RepID=UPI00355ADF34